MKILSSHISEDDHSWRYGDVKVGVLGEDFLQKLVVILVDPTNCNSSMHPNLTYHAHLRTLGQRRNDTTLQGHGQPSAVLSDELAAAVVTCGAMRRHLDME